MSELGPKLPPRGNPKAAADWYRKMKEFGAWEDEYGEMLYMLQDSDEQIDELDRLMDAVDGKDEDDE